MRPRPDTTVLFLAGAALLVLAGVFGWNELEVSAPYFTFVAAVVAAVVSLLRLEVVPRWLAPLLLFGTTVASGFAWLMFKQPPLLIGVAVATVAAAWQAHQLARTPVVPLAASAAFPLRLPEFLTWQTLGLGLLTLISGASFHLVTLEVESLARRPALTAVWTLLGLVGLWLGRRRKDTAPRDAGFVVLGFAIVKAAVYDSTHLFGGLRIGALAAIGGLLVVSGLLLRRQERDA